MDAVEADVTLARATMIAEEKGSALGSKSEFSQNANYDLWKLKCYNEMKICCK